MWLFGGYTISCSFERGEKKRQESRLQQDEEKINVLFVREHKVMQLGIVIT